MNFYEMQIRTITNVLKNLIYTNTDDIKNIEFVQSDYKKSNTPPSDGWKPFDADTSLSGIDSHYWFHFSVKTPSAEEYKKNELLLTTGREGSWDATNPQCTIFIDGETVQALDVNHTSILLEDGKTCDIYVYFYVGMLDGKVEFKPQLRTYDTRIEKLWYDITVPYDTAMIFDKEKDEYILPMKELDIAVQLLDIRNPYSDAFYESIAKCEQYLQENYYEKLCGKKNFAVSLIGHTHIDVAWKWTLAQTVEKAQRSFSTVLNLMEQYPEYKFMSSQPQLYKYVKQTDPKLYERIKTAIKDKSWEAEGAMWLEADCNLSSGESLVRQIIFGKRFMQEEFDVDNKILWLPDVFGYSAAMPQIMKKTGINKFVTSKISWNETNRMPHDTFMWQGIDGTQIFTHFMTANDVKYEHDESLRGTRYNGDIRPTQIYGTYKRNSDKQYVNNSFITFGFGDGGGGPTKSMLEIQRRTQKGLVGLPMTKIEFAGDFLNRIEGEFHENCAKLKKTPKWVGELYLEFHRGTYTNMAKNKRYNRKSELLLQTAETLSGICMQKLDDMYPQNLLNDNWEIVLLNQFHDIIPGSSIKEVYEDSHKQYEEVIRQVGEVESEKLHMIADNISTDGGLFVYNPTPFTATHEVYYNGEYIVAENIPSHGWSVIASQSSNKTKADAQCLENDFVKVCFDDNYDISSIYDKQQGREVIECGKKANQLQIFEDRPYAYDCWELSEYYKNKMWTLDKPESVEIIRKGAKSGLKITRKYNNSLIEQIVWINSYNARIDFDTKIDWHEDHVIMKAAFPFAIHADTATYETQFGSLQRPTHANTSWDAAKFEVCAHKWADLSEDDYGVSLLNDCKYGYNTEDNVMKLSLLKAATDPNPVADRGQHEFTYSVLPHSGNLAASDTVKESYLLNMPFECVALDKQEGKLDENYSFISSDNDDVVIETIKKAENEDALVVRMYVCKNKHANATLQCGFDIKSAAMCDMLENNESDIACEKNSIKLALCPFEICTIKLYC